MVTKHMTPPGTQTCPLGGPMARHVHRSAASFGTAGTAGITDSDTSFEALTGVIM